mmetsp:Transcript_22692/g.25820  ORF Transcript_22692/g.25820 Transcript_22692/m.25820 type:complete len:640 (+) Transcript_22692:58-1977(+)
MSCYELYRPLVIPIISKSFPTLFMRILFFRHFLYFPYSIFIFPFSILASHKKRETKMGCSSSKLGLLHDIDGDGKHFLEKYQVGRILGRGEFGIVKIVYDKSKDDDVPLACKILRKGMQFKDNTLYSAIKPHVLQAECEILRILKGQHHTLKLEALFESPSAIYILTEYIQGGDMFEYASQYYSAEEGEGGGGGLRTEDVSRISFELLDAVNHCAKHGIMHRDIKPENIMFKDAEKGSSLRLIDFGSGTFSDTMSPENRKKNESNQAEIIETMDGSELHVHTTFAGSAFYISPEMFRKYYTLRTDVWSVGVTLYVLVSGYPADALQTAFNKLQDNTRDISTLKLLPNMPENIPETFFEMLDECLKYKHRTRKSAKEILDCEFVKFHKEHAMFNDGGDSNFISAAGVPAVRVALSLNQVIADSRASNRTKSMVIKGSVSRHTAMMKYGQFERSVTSLLASVFVKSELKAILEKIDEVIASHDGSFRGMLEKLLEETIANKKRLQVIKIAELRQILKDLKLDDVLPIIDDISRGVNYDNYAYHVTYLRQFYTIIQDEDTSNQKNGDELDNTISRKLKLALASYDAKTGSHHLTMSMPSSAANSHEMEEAKQIPSSVHNGNVWDTISKNIQRKQKLTRRPSI